MNVTTEITAIVLLAVGNGLFAGAEIAMLSVRRGQLLEQADAGSGAARVALELRSNPERFLATVQIGITVIGATAAAFGGASLARRLGAAFVRMGMTAERAGDLGLALVIILVSYLSLVLGELVPKSIGIRYAQTFTLLAARPLRLLASIARPMVWFLTASSNVVLRLFGDHTNFAESRLSPDELEQLIDEAVIAKTLDARAGEIASRAFGLVTLTVAAVKVPRSDLLVIRRERMLADLAECLQRSPHDRYPVIDGDDIDKATAYIVSREAVVALKTGDVADVKMHPLAFVPETRRAVEVLSEMQRSGNRMAMVVDEAGVVSGLVTLEDLLEEVVGPIRGESKKVDGWVETTDGEHAIVRGRAPIHEVNRLLELELPESPRWTTISGFVVTEVGRIPAVGHKIEIKGATIEVVEVTPRRVAQVAIHKSK